MAILIWSVDVNRSTIAWINDIQKFQLLIMTQSRDISNFRELDAKLQMVIQHPAKFEIGRCNGSLKQANQKNGRRKKKKKKERKKERKIRTITIVDHVPVDMAH